MQTTTGIRARDLGNRQTGSATFLIPYSVAPGDLRLPVVVVRLAERLRDVIDEIVAAPDDGWAPPVVDEELRAVDAIIDLAASGLSVAALSEGAGVITGRDPRARLTDLPAAMCELESGLVRGKIVATV